MLRGILIGLGLAVGVCAIGLLAYGLIGPALAFAAFGGLLLLGTLFERVQYKPLNQSVPAGSVATDERFVDDESGKTVTVYVDPKTGERTYITD